MLKSNIDSHCGSRVQASSKFKVTGSCEKQSKHDNSSPVASVNLPVHTKCVKSASVKTDKIVTKNLQCSPSHVGFVCPTANRFAYLALKTEEQNNNRDSRVETDQYSHKNELKPTKHSVKVCKESKKVKKAIQYILVIMTFRTVKKGDKIVKNSQNCALIRLKTNMI